MSSYHQKKFAHLRIPHQEIKSATNNFSDANRIRGTSFEPVYNGKLLRSGHLVGIVARIWFSRSDQEDEMFWQEVSMLSTLKHDNLVPIVGFCDDENYMKIIIYKHEGNGSLNKYLKDPTLTWMQRLQICVGIARALNYIYYHEGRDFSVIHHDIRSSKILLDDHWRAKLYGFELSLKQIAAARNRLCSSNNHGWPGYADPTSVESGYVGHKSDMYSFGVLLFEVLTGEESVKDRLLAPLVKSCYEEGGLEDMIDPGLRKQIMDPKSLKIFSETALYCLKDQLSQRPNVDRILIKLTEALDSQRKHDNPFKGSSGVEGTTFKSLKDKNLEHMKIPLIDIVSATNNFAKTHLIGAGGFGEVYKGVLDHFDHDSENWLPSEENNVCEFPKKRSTVAIKRILIREDDQGEQGFLAEIELLTSCKHRNIVSLLGFCKEDSHMILVYEYVPNGSLDDYLGITGKLTNLSWVQRINICIDIASGLNYLHTKVDGERKIIHRDIKSGNILLGENWEAKIADFGLSKFRPENNQKENNTLYTQHIAGTAVYLDPEYDKKGKLKNETDIYSFGVVLFEILFGRFANDQIYTKEDSNGLAPVARQRFSEGTIKHMLDPRLMEETGENIFNLSNGPNPKSLDAFINIAHQCVAITQAQRPSAQVIVTKLKEALSYQENPEGNLKIRLEDILRATQNFSADNLISRERAMVYTGKVTRDNRSHPIVVKEFETDDYDSEEQCFVRELQILSEYKHQNIIGLVGYCKERGHKIIVTEYASQGSLRKHLNNKSLTWIKRLEICIDVARGLEFLHGGGLIQEVVIHRDINTTHILLDDDWKAKISGFTISCKSSINTNLESGIDDAFGYLAYRDPLYMEMGFLTTKSDIYSLGWVLFEILTGIWFCWATNDEDYDLNPIYKSYYEKGTLHEKVFKSIEQQIAPKSLAAFKTIAYQCLHGEREKRPTAREVVLKLEKALEFQRNFEILEPKLPKDYKEIFQKSNSPDIYSTEGEKDLYDLLCKGILLEESKVLFTLGSNEERNEMVSAKAFSYINHSRHKWRGVRSRFPVVAEMLDISNLNIKIKAKAQFLSSDVLYGVYLVFKFCDPRKVSSKPLYVNLKYKNGRKTSHSYFATWRDNEWMMIELCRFSNNKTDIVFRFLLESFSRYYCGDTNIYVEGVEFRPIDNAKGEKIKEQVLTSDSIMDTLQQLPTKLDYLIFISGEKLLLLSDVDGCTHVMLSAKAALHNSSNTKLFKRKPSTQSSFLEEVQLPQQQVFRINCKIETKMLVPGIDYECYIVFKLSEKCRGLQCPVKVLDLRRRKNKEARVIYFRSPSPWNLHDTFRAPELRKDGWMEVKVWKFNLNHDLKNYSFPVNLKLISYEGTMSGLIVCGLEFRPM